jgi:hypothetical protein
MWLTSPSNDADRGKSMSWQHDGGSQTGGSEGKRSSGREACSYDASVSIEGRRGGRSALISRGEQGERTRYVCSRFILI